MESNGRIAELMAQLSDGRTMALTDIQTSYDVSRRTAQRDLAFIRHAVIEYNIGNLVENNGAYQLVAKDSIDNYAIVLAISNILLGSRALTTEELTLSINFLMQRLSPTVKQELSEQLIFPKNSYLPLSQARPLLKLLRDMAKCIQHHQKICFTYISNSVTPQNPKHLLTCHAQPITIFCESYYFYVAMLSEEHHGYWLYRLDRIKQITKKSPAHQIDANQHFSLQNHRQQSLFANTGALTTIRFIYRNPVQDALDTFPNAHILKQNTDSSYLIEIRVKTDGALKWFLSQGTALQVVSPQSLIKRIQHELKQTLTQY